MTSAVLSLVDALGRAEKMGQPATRRNGLNSGP